MTKKQMLDAMRAEFKTCMECEKYYSDTDNQNFNPTTAHDFFVRATQTKELAFEFFGVDLLDEYLDEMYPIAD